MDMNYAYVAGLIDGEGCIHLDVTRGLYYRARVSVGMTEPALTLLQELQKEWGGTLYQLRPQTERWAAAWTWHMTGTPAANLLVAIQPYLRIKSEQARLALEVETVRSSLPERRRGQAAWTPEAQARCAAIKEQMHALNLKGPRASAKSAEVA